MIRYHHRDIIQKVIQLNDYVVWSNGKYNQQMQICKVVGVTQNKVTIEKGDGTLTRVYPNKLIVVTQQVYHNIENNVGANA